MSAWINFNAIKRLESQAVVDDCMTLWSVIHLYISVWRRGWVGRRPEWGCWRREDSAAARIILR